MTENPERIISAAMQDRKTGLISSGPPPARHHDLIRMLVAVGQSVRADEIDQGFLTSEGRYVGRKEAAVIALVADQIPRPDGPTPCAPGGRLYSEDLF